MAAPKEYDVARERYAALGVDSDAAVRSLASVPLSLHCWQGDDIRGFERAQSEIGGGLAVTGSYPGAARNADELRLDIEKALSLIPGRHRLNLHAIYAETGGKTVARDELLPEHFSRWSEWALQHDLHGLDFNPTFFAHPLASDGFTLSHLDSGVRRFWIRHGQACRRIGASFGRELGAACVTNVWIPDGYKDLPADRQAPRERLAESLDEVFRETLDPAENIDAVECKLFGLGSESYVVGSHEFYLGYAISRGKALCLDAGHFHPTEGISDKISAVLLWVDRLLLHVSRGVRWDSDHVVILSDEVREIAKEVVRGNCLERVHIGLDFFDASINRVAAWVIGSRAVLKALLMALLEPRGMLTEMERNGDFTGRLALLEQMHSMPSGAVWDHWCEHADVPRDGEWMDEIRLYEHAVQSRRADQH
ncbi:MAG: L-rhamnose isomerase [Bryobacterales bacterium]|nr:L-rhamnose isomerase [Bryobacterales bacterium]